MYCNSRKGIQKCSVNIWAVCSEFFQKYCFYFTEMGYQNIYNSHCHGDSHMIKRNHILINVVAAPAPPIS